MANVAEPRAVQMLIAQAIDHLNPQTSEIYKAFLHGLALDVCEGKLDSVQRKITAAREGHVLMNL